MPAAPKLNRLLAPVACFTLPSGVFFPFADDLMTTTLPSSSSPASCLSGVLGSCARATVLSLRLDVDDLFAPLGGLFLKTGLGGISSSIFGAVKVCQSHDLGFGALGACLSVQLRRCNLHRSTCQGTLGMVPGSTRIFLGYPTRPNLLQNRNQVNARGHARLGTKANGNRHRHQTAAQIDSDQYKRI